MAESPDTQIALYDYDKLLVSFELTLFGDYILKSDNVLRRSDMFPLWMQNSTRIEIFGTEGMMLVGRHGGGWQVFVTTQKSPASHQGPVRMAGFLIRSTSRISCNRFAAASFRRRTSSKDI